MLFDLQHIAFVTGLRPSVLGWLSALPDRQYARFRIPKRQGGSRELSAPRPALKHVQRWVHQHILTELEVHSACHGFARGRSIATNAAPHVQHDLVLKLDLIDFFPSVRSSSVYRLFRRVGYSASVARLLTSLVTLNGGLPQGSPASPQLANLIATEMDRRLSGFASSHGLIYTRYADDLTFSGPFVAHYRAKRMIETIVRDSGFRPNEAKARYLHRSTRQSVTGIVVNDVVNWPRSRRRWLRQELYYLERFGVDAHLARRGSGRRRYKEFIYGHVYALNMVRPDLAQPLLTRLDGIRWTY